MPFDFKKYDAKCATLDGDALQREWEHYTRLISGAATSTAVSGVAIPFTLGVSSIGVGLAAPAIHNARKKREIIEKHLQRVGRTHHTRKRDVITAGAISGTVGVVTLGLAPVGADAICNTAAEHSIAYIAENELAVKIATHLTLDAVAVAAEETHMNSKKEHEALKAYSQSSKVEGNLSSGSTPIIPTTMHSQALNSYTSFPETAFQNTPTVNVVPPWQQQPSVEAAAVYFPPPPGQADLKPEILPHRRHSVSTLSFNAEKPVDKPLQPPSDGHLIIGTTTAISGPMPGGQSYPIQLPEKSAYFSNEVNSNPVQSYNMNIQQYQPSDYKSGTYSMASFDTRRSYVDNSHVQPSFGNPPPSPQPHLALMPSLPPPPPYTPTIPAGPGNQPTWYQNYNPNHYAEPQQQSFYPPAEPPHSPYITSNQKAPLVYQYEVQNSVSTPSWPNQPIAAPNGTVIYYNTPSPQPNYPYQPEKAPMQQTSYFPPPPTAY